jgi:hypothetical protein
MSERINHWDRRLAWVEPRHRELDEVRASIKLSASGWHVAEDIPAGYFQQAGACSGRAELSQPRISRPVDQPAAYPSFVQKYVFPEGVSKPGRDPPGWPSGPEPRFATSRASESTTCRH